MLSVTLLKRFLSVPFPYISTSLKSTSYVNITFVKFGGSGEILKKMATEAELREEVAKVTTRMEELKRTESETATIPSFNVVEKNK